jgi:hypothetical protein
MKGQALPKGREPYTGPRSITAQKSKGLTPRRKTETSQLLPLIPSYIALKHHTFCIPDIPGDNLILKKLHNIEFFPRHVREHKSKITSECRPVPQHGNILQMGGAKTVQRMLVQSYTWRSLVNFTLQRLFT